MRGANKNGGTYGKIYEFLRSNVMTRGVTERRTLMTRVVIDTF